MVFNHEVQHQSQVVQVTVDSSGTIVFGIELQEAAFSTLPQLFSYSLGRTCSYILTKEPPQRANQVILFLGDLEFVLRFPIPGMH